jgi:hypothetical protein
MCIIVTLAAAETILEVLVVFVVWVRKLRVDFPLCVGFWVYAQRAGRGGWQTCCSTIASEVSLIEELHQCMFAMALYRARVTHAGWFVGVGKILRRVAR